MISEVEAPGARWSIISGFKSGSLLITGVIAGTDPDSLEHSDIIQRSN